MILLQELFATRYFCQEQKEEHFLLAESEGKSSLVERFQGLAKELRVVSERHLAVHPRPACQHESYSEPSTYPFVVWACLQRRPRRILLVHATSHETPTNEPTMAAAQVLPISFFERGNNAYFNSVVVFDADGRRLGLYRKSHIPDGPGYQV